MSKLWKGIAAYMLHDHLKNKAVKKAVEKTKKELDPAFKWYIFVPEKKKIAAFDATASSQDFLNSILILRSLIKSFGGENQIQLEMSHGTIVYFTIPRSSTKPLMQKVNKLLPEATLGEAKKFNK